MDINYIIGLVAAALTAFGLIPQVIKIIQTNDTKNISLGMYILYFIAGILWIVYGIMNKSHPIIISNSITLVSTVVILFYKIKSN